jgi:transposase
VLLTWSVYQRIIAAYSQSDRRRGKTMMTAIIDSLRGAIPAKLEELAQLGRTLHRRTDVLAYFDHHASNGPTEAINGRLEALRRNALGHRRLVDDTHLAGARRSTSPAPSSTERGRERVDPHRSC